MTPTNEQIYTALITILNGAALGYPVIYEGFTKTPPSTGVWLQVSFFPNRGIDYDTANTEEVVPQGNFQVEVFTRPFKSLAEKTALDTAIFSVMSLYAKGTAITGRVRVYRPPYANGLDPLPDRISTVVTIPYSG